MTGPDNSRDQQGRFRRGRSGNPAGRRQGSRNRATLMLDRLMEAGAEEIVRVVIERAREGDLAAARLVLERVMPAPKSRSIPYFELPPLEDASGLPGTLLAVISGVAGGRLTPDEGAALAGLLESHRRAVETVDLEKRIAALERKEGAGDA